MKRKLIGHVGVDSGQLLITDPCYIGSEWSDREFQDIRNYRDTITSKIYSYGKHFNNYEEKLLDGKTVNELIHKGRLVQMKEQPTLDYSYAGACEATLSDDGAGQLHFKLGHAGAGVAFSSGYGDGYYPVYAYYNEEGRIVRVVIDTGMTEAQREFFEAEATA